MRQWILYISVVLMPAAHATEEYVADNMTFKEFITLEQTIARVLESNPQLKASDFENKAMAARIRSASLTPPYRTGLDVQNFAGSGPFGSTDQLETTLSLSKVLELGDKAEIRTEIARHNVTLLRNENDAKRLDLLAEATNRFVHVVRDQLQLEIIKASVDTARNTLAVVKKRVRAGRSPEAELRRARITLARKKLQLEHAQHELATTRLMLTTAWGSTRPAFKTAKANLFDVKTPAEFSEYEKLLKQNPELLRFATKKRLAETRLRLAKAKQSANIEVGAGIRHFNATDDTAVVMSFSLPLGSSSRASAAIEENEMMNLREPHVYQQRYLDLYSTLYEVYQEISHALEAVEVLRKQIIPDAERSLRDYEKGYAAGRYSFLTLIEAQRVLRDSQLEAVEMAAKYHQYRTEIDRLTGTELTKGENP